MPSVSRTAWPADAAGAGVRGGDGTRHRRPARCRRPGRQIPAVGDRDELLHAIRADAVVRGDFVLSSGQRASSYVDLRRVLLAGRYARGGRAGDAGGDGRPVL